MATLALETEEITLDEFLAAPANQMEWVDGKLVETTGMTIRHSKLQFNLGYLWKNYAIESGQGGEVYTELPCRTSRQGRRPDVSYLTAELAEQFRDAPSLPQSPILIAEIASPTDAAENLLSKATEYLESGCEEVWLLFPENRRVLIFYKNQILGVNPGQVLSTQVILPGFSMPIDELLA